MSKNCKDKVVVSVSFACNQCGTSSMLIMGAVKTADDKTYIVCQCENGHQVPLNIDHVVIKLFEASPSKLAN